MEQSPGKLDEDAIRAKAYELWLERGCPPGSAEDDWLEAERLLAVQPETEAAPLTPPVAETTTRKASAPPAKASRR
jgi:hypothetical protein